MNTTLNIAEALEADLEQEDRRIDYLPTIAEISTACARIRSEWTTSEKRRRFVGELVPDDLVQDWRPPVIDTSHFRLCFGASGEGV